MYRVLLVDDEPFARMALRTTFDWESHGFSLIGEASNGKSALRWIERNEVDILITDIAMPVMDGLELMRMARERSPWIKIVLLSCHSDFAYVREAMRLGASDYILKPTLEPEGLKEILEKVKLQLLEERKINSMYIQNELSEKRIELEKAFMKMVAGEASAVHQPDHALLWMNEGYRIVVCLLDGALNFLSEEDVYVEITMEEIQESYYEIIGEGVAVRGFSGPLIMIMPQPNEQCDFMERVSLFQSKLKSRGFSFTLGVSRRFTGAESVKQAMQEGKMAAKLRFYEGLGGILPYEPYFCGADKSEAEALMIRLKEAITVAGREKASVHLNRLMQYWTKEHRTPTEVKREAQDLISLFEMCRNKRITPVEQIEALAFMETVDEVQGLIRHVFEKLWSSGDESEEDLGTHRRIVGNAVAYLKAHYKQNISLQDVADHVAVSKNYFSEMFKKVMDQNFIDYLTHLRLKCACELLRTTTLKVYEVAELSGFNDVKYFSKVFKKVMKVSPADYREGRG
ncbi:response regulator [Paenibacillus piri]|uniref:Response regulator n=1 Tax=Paenibacillus piri TaxID=2547395 RepID=A0A4R5KY44_9BACL|nr:response regulator [Paenibacillus piri]